MPLSKVSLGGSQDGGVAAQEGEDALPACGPFLSEELLCLSETSLGKASSHSRWALLTTGSGPVGRFGAMPMPQNITKAQEEAQRYVDEHGLDRMVTKLMNGASIEIPKSLLLRYHRR